MAERVSHTCLTSERGGVNDEEPLNIYAIPQPAGELWAVRLADGFVVRLTHNKWEDGVPTWSGVMKSGKSVNPSMK